MLLAIETAAEQGGVAVVGSGRVLSERILGVDDQPASLLIPAVHEVLEEAGLAPGDPWPIALSIGPGSFTGLRIGLSTALGLCFGTPREIVPVPTLAALAFGAGLAHGARGPVVPMLDARKGQVYAGIYAPDGREQDDAPLAGDRVCDPVPFLEKLRELGPCTLLGPGAQAVRKEIDAVLGGGVTVLDPEAGWPRAAHVGLLGLRGAESGATRPPEGVELRYLRPSEAELGRRLYTPG